MNETFMEGKNMNSIYFDLVTGICCCFLTLDRQTVRPTDRLSQIFRLFFPLFPPLASRDRFAIVWQRLEGEGEERDKNGGIGG